MLTDANNEGDLISSRHVRNRYGGVSHMWIERRLKDDPTFPKPIYISRNRYWRVADLIAWERQCALRGPNRHKATDDETRAAA